MEWRRRESNTPNWRYQEASFHKRCVQKAAHDPPQKLVPDRHLSQIVQVWPRLPAYIKAAIRALVETSKKATGKTLPNNEL